MTNPTAARNLLLRELLDALFVLDGLTTDNPYLVFAGLADFEAVQKSSSA